jgi:hypothetical protein
MKTERYQIQVQSILNGEWYDISPDIWSQPCTKEGYAQLVDDIEELTVTQERSYRIIKRVSIVDEEVFYTKFYQEKQ